MNEGIYTRDTGRSRKRVEPENTTKKKTHAGKLKNETSRAEAMRKKLRVGKADTAETACGFVAIVCVNNAYLFWAPTIFHERFGVEATEAGAHAMFYHHLAAFAAILAGGSITDRFVSRFPRFRLGLQISSLLVGAPVLYFIGRSSGFGFAVAMTAAYGIFRGLFEANTHASVFDVVPANCRASIVGFMLLIAFFVGGWFSGDFMGSLLERAGERGFELAFAVMGGVYALAALLMSISFFFTFSRARCKLNSM